MLAALQPRLRVLDGQDLGLREYGFHFGRRFTLRCGRGESAVDGIIKWPALVSCPANVDTSNKGRMKRCPGGPDKSPRLLPFFSKAQASVYNAPPQASIARPLGTMHESSSLSKRKVGSFPVASRGVFQRGGFSQEYAHFGTRLKRHQAHGFAKKPGLYIIACVVALEGTCTSPLPSAAMQTSWFIEGPRG